MIHIAYYFPPIKSVGVNRSNRLANELASFFSRYTVYTTSNRKRLPGQVLPINDSIKVVEVPTFDFRTFFSFFRKNEKVHFNADFKKRFLLVWWAKLIASFPFNIFLGQGGLIYILLSFKRIVKQVKKNPNDYVVFSVFHPYADHVIAYLIKKRFPKVLWIADFKDLHIDPVYKNYLWGPIQVWFNKKILQEADFLTTVSDGLAISLRQFNKDVFVLPNGVANIPCFIGHYNDKFTISYTGVMFQNKRRPHLLLKVLMKLISEDRISKDKIQIRQAGRDVAIWNPIIKQFGLEDIFNHQGILPLKSAHLMQQRSHVNLLLTTSHKEYKGFLTSKLFEYFAAGNPVLVLINGPKDKLFEDAVSGITPLHIAYGMQDERLLEDFILELYNKWERNEEYPRIAQDSWIDRYYWPNSIHGLLKKIKETIK